MRFNLRREMRRKKLTPEEVAVALGVRERLVRRWLSDAPSAGDPSWQNIERLADFFGRSPSWFFVDHHRNGQPPGT